MNIFANLWSAYGICYAIGYMLFVRSRFKNPKTADRYFYVSLLVLATIKFMT
jgi:hypothetical protein